MKCLTKLMVFFLAMILWHIPKVQASDAGYLVQFKDGYKPDVAIYNLNEVNADKGIYSAKSIDNLNAISQYIEYTSPNSNVFLIEGEYAAPRTLLKSALSSEQWQLQFIHADSSWNLEAYGNDIKVGVIDSGCFEHEDLKHNLLSGKNYLTKTSNVTDNTGHGTHVSGIIAAEMNNTGISGVAPKAKIVPLKCFDPIRTTYVKDLLAAIYDAVDVYDCNVINMSWGLSYDDPFLREAIDYAHSKGVILVAAVGNYSSTVPYYPAAYENVIGVSSVGPEKKKSSFAQYNTSVLVTAPGENVKSTYKNGDYQYLQGTSQAAPMVSGLAAAALSINPNLTNSEFRQLLIETAEDLGDTGYDTEYGYGLVNGQALIDRLMQNTEYYVSPINEGTEGTYVLIKNNTEDVLRALSIFSEYVDTRFAGCFQTQITLLPGQETIVAPNGITRHDVAHFLLREPLDPLTAKRERK